MPVHFRASLTLPRSAHALRCITRDLHAEGALLQFSDEVPAQLDIGSHGRLWIEIAPAAPVEFLIDVRHRKSQRVGVRFLQA